MRSVARSAAAVCVLTLCGFTAAVSQDKSGSRDVKPVSDEEFVIKAASSGMHEVEIGQAAQNQAQSAEVKKFGERLVTDHTKANKELMQIAKTAGLSVPTKMLDEHQKMVEKFKNLKGAEFDREFIRHAVESHKKGIELFTGATRGAKNAELKAFAEKTLPTLKEHLELAQRLDKEGGRDK
jgi:putative membrane protein